MDGLMYPSYLQEFLLDLQQLGVYFTSCLLIDWKPNVSVDIVLLSENTIENSRKGDKSCLEYLIESLFSILCSLFCFIYFLLLENLRKWILFITPSYSNRSRFEDSSVMEVWFICVDRIWILFMIFLYFVDLTLKRLMQDSKDENYIE